MGIESAQLTFQNTQQFDKQLDNFTETKKTSKENVVLILKDEMLSFQDKTELLFRIKEWFKSGESKSKENAKILTKLNSTLEENVPNNGELSDKSSQSLKSEKLNGKRISVKQARGLVQTANGNGIAKTLEDLVYFTNNIASYLTSETHNNELFLTTNEEGAFIITKDKSKSVTAGIIKLRRCIENNSHVLEDPTDKRKTLSLKLKDEIPLSLKELKELMAPKSEAFRKNKNPRTKDQGQKMFKIKQMQEIKIEKAPTDYKARFGPKLGAVVNKVVHWRDTVTENNPDENLYFVSGQQGPFPFRSESDLSPTEFKKAAQTGTEEMMQLLEVEVEKKHFPQEQLDTLKNKGTPLNFGEMKKITDTLLGS